jgi:hypothetical protein
MAFVTTYLTELGLGLVALLGIGGLVARRRKGSAPQAPAARAAAVTTMVPAPAPAPVAAETDSIVESMLAPQADLEEVDPLAEAEVYLTYGRENQAEEILHEAIARTPSRHELHLKLLGIYAKRGDVAAFEPVARKLYTVTRGKGEAWQAASEMGASIDPANPLYSSGRPVASPTAPTVSSAPVAAAAVAASPPRSAASGFTWRMPCTRAASPAPAPVPSRSVVSSRSAWHSVGLAQPMPSPAAGSASASLGRAALQARMSCGCRPSAAKSDHARSVRF